MGYSFCGIIVNGIMGGSLVCCFGNLCPLCLFLFYFLFIIYTHTHTHTVLHLVLCNCKQAKEGVFYNLKVHLQVFIALLSFMTHSMEMPFVGHLKSYVLIYVILFDINVCSCHRFLILDLCQESLSTF